MRNVFSYSFSTGMQQWRVSAIVYFFQWCLALTLGMQAHSVLESSIGHSLEINKLLTNYDHTVITDFLKVHGASITPLIGQLRWLLLVWLLFSVFINAGMLFCVSEKSKTTKPSGRTFWQGGAEYFFPFLKISLLFLALALVWTILILMPLALYFQPSIEYFPSEKYSVWMAISLMVIYLLGLTVLFVWSVISRFVRINSEASIIRSVRKGWTVFRQKKWGLLGLMAGFIALQLALLAIYWLLEAFTGMTSPGLILFLFVAQQVFVFFRIQIRQMMYAGIGRLMNPVG